VSSVQFPLLLVGTTHACASKICLGLNNQLSGKRRNRLAGKIPSRPVRVQNQATAPANRVAGGPVN
jgi:hypothetical protein